MKPLHLEQWQNLFNKSGLIFSTESIFLAFEVGEWEDVYFLTPLPLSVTCNQVSDQHLFLQFKIALGWQFDGAIINSEKVKNNLNCLL